MKIKLFAAREIQYFVLRFFSFNSYVYYLPCGFIASTRAFNLPTRAFSLPTHPLNLVTHTFNVLTRGIELITHRFELVTRIFELATRGFELVIRGFELITLTRVLLFHVFNITWLTEILKIYLKEQPLIKYCAIKHLILLKILDGILNP